MLGEFEYLIVSAAARLGDEAYGAAMRQEIEIVTGRRCSLGALYTTLDRLESKGIVEGGVRYVKHNALAGRADELLRFEDYLDLA